MAHILLLEDDITLSRQIASMLEMDGHDVVTFTSSGDAVEYVEDTPVDLLIVDIFLKKGSVPSKEGGIILISKIRQALNLRTPIIAISGAFGNEGSGSVRGSAMTVGASVTVAKPFYPDDLGRIVEEQLSSNR